MKESTRPDTAPMKRTASAPLIAASATSVEANPVYFGPTERPLFGWLHDPGRTSSGGVGLVICNPFGDEAIRTQRTIRHLAEDAARSGIPALRFDYDGTGDSAGHDLDADRLTQWVGSIRFAAQALRQWTSVDRVCFAGLRLGASLAALACSEAGVSAAGLIAIAPVVNGRAYVRELRLLRRAIEARRTHGPAKRNIAHTDDGGALETAGFLLSAPTQAALSAIDLTRLEHSPAPRVLILDRAELPADERWPRHLRNRGVHVEHERVQGYTEMMLDAHDGIVPEAIKQATVRWLQNVSSEHERPPQGRPQLADVPRRHVTLPSAAGSDPVFGSEAGSPISEWAVQLPGAGRLFGIVSAPENLPRSATGIKAALFVNAGAVHRIGPCRLYVAMARHLARQGCVALRLDIAGIGDSPPRPGHAENVVYPAHATDDIALAAEYLRREWGAGEIRAVGLCSGAYHSFKAAVAKQPLQGIVAINPLTFFWKEGMSLEYPEHRVAQDMMRYRNNALSPAAWRKLLSGRVNLPSLAQVLGRGAITQLLKPMLAAARLLRIPLREDLRSELLRVADAGIHLQFVFAAQDPGLELLRDKGGSTVERLRERGQLDIALIENADHTFTDLAVRTQLAALLARLLGADA